MVWALVHATPIGRCFQGGQLLMQKTSQTSISEFCLKDDVSLIKSEVEYHKNDTGLFGISRVYRHWTISDWKTCKPIKAAGGGINVIELDQNMNLITSTYICSQDCIISVDKENAMLLFQTEKMNHFEVVGTTMSTGWFKSKATVTLDRTCEHIKVSCGKKSLQFHACFRNHMSCVRFLHRTILPGYMAESICQNIELIIILILTVMIFVLLCILTKTYICYILMPIFMPVAYLYGWIYNKSCKKCQCCGLAYHPFTNCGSYCVCGARFETSDRIRLHRESGLCQGYKSLRTARRLCKSKGSSLIISVILSTLILSFVTPIEGYYTEDKDKYTLEEIADILQDRSISSEAVSKIIFVSTASSGCLAIILLFISILLHKIMKLIIKISVIFCDECGMYHSRKGMKFFGDFTNKCGFCTCGQLEDVEGLNIHKTNLSCTFKYQYKWLRGLIMLWSILLILENSIIIAAAEDCFKITQPSLDCIGPLVDIGSCTDKSQRTYESEATKLVSEAKLTSSNAKGYTALGDTLETGLRALATDGHFLSTHALELIFLRRYCDYYKAFEHNSGYSQVKWRAISRTEQYDICSRHSTHHFCRCLADGTKCQNGDWDFAQEMNSTYNTKHDFYAHDLTFTIKLFVNAFPGTASSYLCTKIKEHNSAESAKIFEKIWTKYGNNKLLVGIMKFGKYLTTLPFFSTYELPREYERLILRNSGHELRTSGQKTSMASAIVGPKSNECINAKKISCLSPRFGLPIGELLGCGPDNMKIYKKPSKIYNTLKNNKWCNGDMHCLKEFEPAVQDVVNKIKTMTCWLQEPTANDDVFTIAINSCRMSDKGQCIVGENQWSVMRCDSGLLYYTDHRPGEDTGNDIGHYCISHKCNTDRYPLNPEIVKDCVWEYKSRKATFAKEHSLDNLEDYKRSLIEKLSHDLQIYKFKPLKDLPHIKPVYKYITADGVVNSDGIEGAYITAEIPAVSGSSIGYNIISKDNQPLLDIIVYIKSAIIKTQYNHIYDTGPTVGINTKHDEQCTGSCPTEIEHDANWLTFSQERTSRWGCEDWGCLAINTGCVYGSCQDIIRPEARVYRKAMDETILLTACIAFPGQSYCTEINAIEPKITEQIELQFKTIDMKTMPSIILVRNHKLYSGQINDLATFGQMCGNVQKTNQSILGAGTVKFDYICYGASRKDVIIRKCYNNNYDSCKYLREESTLLFEDNHETISVYNPSHLVGQLQMKLILGDIRYKTFSEKVDLQVDAKCVGCPDCFESYMCNLQIVSTIDTNCAISGPCDIFHDRILITANNQNYAIKMSCKSDPPIESKIEICKNKYDLHITTIPKDDKIEINTGDQSSYIRERDNRCGTWLCKVYNEGISALFEPLKAIFGKYFDIFIYGIIILVALFISIYFLMPMCMKCKDTLKHNEKLYQQEIKQR